RGTETPGEKRDPKAQFEREAAVTGPNQLLLFRLVGFTALLPPRPEAGTAAFLLRSGNRLFQLSVAPTGRPRPEAKAFWLEGPPGTAGRLLRRGNGVRTSKRVDPSIDVLPTGPSGVWTMGSQLGRRGVLPTVSGGGPLGTRSEPGGGNDDPQVVTAF